MGGAAETRTLRERLTAREITAEGSDGESYVLRPIQPSDAPSLIRGYAALSERERWLRLLHAVPVLTEEMALDFCTPDPATDLCIVVEGRGDLEGEILGGARIGGAGPGTAAEFSVSLRPEAQGLGLARQALETVIDVAREMGSATVYGSISAENDEMLNLARRLDFKLARDPDNLSLMRAELRF